MMLTSEQNSSVSIESFVASMRVLNLFRGHAENGWIMSHSTLKEWHFLDE